MWRTLKYLVKLPLRKQHLQYRQLRLQRLNYPHRSYCQFTSDYRIYDELICPTSTDDVDRMRVKLYPESSDPNIQALLDCNSMQQIFDLFKCMQPEEKTEQFCSQALVSLWDIQKFIFRFGGTYNPNLEFSRSDYIAVLKEHPVFESIIKSIVENCDKLDDNALAGSLLCFKRLNMGVRSPECQKLIGELINRKASLSLQALARLNVSLRSTSVVSGNGNLIQAEFLPLLDRYVKNMESDQEVRYTSIAIRHANEIVPTSIVINYRKNLHKLYERKAHEQFDYVTQSKVLLALFASQYTQSSSQPEWNIAGELILKYGTLLIPHVEKMDHIDILSLSKFMDYHKEPVQLLKALSRRVAQQFEAAPHIVWLACLDPNNYEQQRVIGAFLSDFIDSSPYFEKLSHVVCRNLKKTRWDLKLYDKYWNKVVQIIQNMSVTFSIHNEYDVEDNNDYFSSTLMEYNDEPIDAKQRQLQILYYGIEYMYCIAGNHKAYRHVEFEKVATKEILQFLEDYENNETFLTPVEYAKCIAFLLVVRHSNIKLKQSFCNNFRIRELVLIHRAMEVGKTWNFTLASMLNRQGETFLNNDLNSLEYLALAKININFQRTFFSSPTFSHCFTEATKSEWTDSRTAGGLMALILGASYCCPATLEKVSKFICDRQEDVPFVLIDRFVCAAYLCGFDELPALKICSHMIEGSWKRLGTLPLLQVMMALNFHGCLSKELIKQIFSVSFLDDVDKQIESLRQGGGSFQPIARVRQIFMELNRAVCIDMPNAHVPWFHQQYCQEQASVESLPDSYLHREVYQVLGEVLRNSEYVLQNKHSPYFHRLDFLLQFDDHGNPIKGSRKPNDDAATKVAILLRNNRDYTTNVKRLKGYHRLVHRHLEILGYKVIHIDPFLWNTMHMSEKFAKHNFLENSIFEKKKITAQNGV